MCAWAAGVEKSTVVKVDSFEVIENIVNLNFCCAGKFLPVDYYRKVSRVSVLKINMDSDEELELMK